jgi:predicted  nucleic acid-binding Zn-ribbon protein
MSIEERIEALTMHLELLSRDREADRALIEADRQRIEADRQRIEADRQRIEADRQRIEAQMAADREKMDHLVTVVTGLVQLARSHEARLARIEGFS